VLTGGHGAQPRGRRSGVPCQARRVPPLIERDRSRHAGAGDLPVGVVDEGELALDGRQVRAQDAGEIEDLILDGSTLAPMSTREIIHVLNAGAHRFAATCQSCQRRVSAAWKICGYCGGSVGMETPPSLAIAARGQKRSR